MGEVLSSWNGDGVFVRGDDPHNSSKSMALFQDKYSTIDETITGTSGDDLILWSGSPSYGSDFIDGGNGKDVISINDYSDNFTIKSQSSGLTYFNDNRGLSYDQYGHAVLSNVEQIEFLDKTVTIRGTSTSSSPIQDKYSTIDETITGTSGDDLILWSGSPSYGSDFIDGGNGKDVISINDYSDNFTIKSQSSGLTYFNDNRGLSYDQYGHAVLSNVEQIEFLDKTVNIGNSSGSDNEVEWNDIYGTRRADELTGTKSADYIDGGKGDDFIYGGAGDDLIVGGKGLDIIEGGEGEDWFVADTKLGRGKMNFDVITDFEVGVDVLMVAGNTKGLWIDNYQGDAILVRGKKDVIAWIDDAGGQLEWGGSDGNLIM